MPRALCLLPVLVLLACEDAVQPDLTVVAAPQTSVLDGSRHGGNPGFHWLPPIAKTAPISLGALYTELLPFLSVEVCEWNGSTCVGEPVAKFNAESDASDRLRIDDDHFQANWKAKDSNLDAAKTYRISVKAAPAELGFADVDVVTTMREAPTIDTMQVVALARNSTLAIKFVVTNGALEAAGAALVAEAGGVVRSADGRVQLQVPPGALSSPTVLAVIPDDDAAVGAFSGAGLGSPYLLQPSGIRFTLPVDVQFSVEDLLQPGDDVDEVALAHYAGDGHFADILPTDLIAGNLLSARVLHFSYLWPRKCQSRTWCVYNVKWERDLEIKWYHNPVGALYLSEEVIQTSLDEWAEYADLTFTKVATESLANLTFREDPEDASCPFWGIGNSAGVTCFGFSARNLPWIATLGESDRVEIIINRGSDGVGPSSAPGTVLHEIGHALGVAHPKKDNDDVVMDADSPSSPTQLHAWDIAAIQHVYGPALPDLVPTALSGPANAQPGEAVAVTGSDRNAGKRAVEAGWVAEIRLTQNGSCSASELDPLALTYAGPHLRRQENVTGTRWATVPTSITPGIYYWCVILDPTSTITESDETNNTLIAGQVTIVVPPPPVPGRIAFVSERSGLDIWLMDEDGSNQTRLTDVGGTHHDFADWSPDGTRMALQCHAPGPQEDICIINADGTGYRRFYTPSRDGQPRWSPDGTRLLFYSESNGVADIFVMDAASGDNVTQVFASAGPDYHAVWSPDGGKIAFASTMGTGNMDVYVLDLGTQALTRITSNAAHDGSPAWSPDGQRLAFASTRSGTGELYLADATALEGNIVRLTFNAFGVRQNTGPAWSPDGQWLAFDSNVHTGTAYDVFKLRIADPSEVVNLSRHAANDEGADWGSVR